MLRFLDGRLGREAGMIEKQITKEDFEKIISFLGRLDLFRSLSRSSLKELASSMSMLFCEGGETIIEQEETTSAMYLVFQGMCRLYEKDNGEERLLSEAMEGQIFGEMSLLANHPKFATAIASRDSILLKWSESGYKLLEKNHPAVALNISKQAIKHLLEGKKSKKAPPDKGLRTFAIIPAGDSDHRPFVRYLEQALSPLLPTIVITKELCNEHFGINIAQAGVEENYHAQISAWLQSLESQYGYLIFESDRQMTPWTKRCLRQADRILLIAEDTVYPTYNSIEMHLFSEDWKYHSAIELILLHASYIISGTSNWLKSRKVAGFHHLMLNSESIKAKFIRILTGQAIGVVLTGGGARGFAHIGFLKAMEEKRIPIDYITGVSMGALIAVAPALGHSTEEMLDFAHRFAYRHQYTLPLVALTTGKFISDMLHSICEDALIEDLWTRYTCLSANITETKLKIHDEGLLWLAIRASLSVPGIFPPVYDSSGNLLVDGGILNNMPVDILRRRMYKGKIICVRCSPRRDRFKKKFIKDTSVSGWKLLLQKMLPFYARSPEYDNIGDIILESMNAASKNFEKTVEDQGDYVIELDTTGFTFHQFDQLDALIEIGYRSTQDNLPSGLF
ncbi:MAG: patatin-like phospholipase family protein [Parachlamydia sp.]|nr:patatin-like phospholipase family protein [Parachlamydia sp.]